MAYSYKFYENKHCVFFPCHEIPDEEGFNCLFCYCPLYFLGDKCGGTFKAIGDGSIKDCSACLIPHDPKNYNYIMGKISEHIHQL